ncbi:hypothetical protein H181DRAFT_00838 [Streptomyces sp. WMMB 714]|uniref:hypothetical protein n=1 Tax=Streptomyces sp. WMMB 714 TaxID=1286822 RepID=UPI0008237C32|nr:hypothetical protein [Streptomyces sp. WMMB 714]SCK13441.1 hypothetical protein H181DRAFT_00838 [Streptomyces sp. WMMB 714]
MSRFATLRPGAHRAGAALLAALAALDLVWIVRDFSKAADVTDAWWMWSGLLFRAQDGIWTSSFVEPTLLVLYTVCAVTALLSSATAGVLLSAGALTILLRVPTLWNLNAGWVQGGVSDGLRTQVLISDIAMLVLGVALIVTVFAGRGTGAPAGDGPPPAGGRHDVPARPTPAGGLAASVLLGAVAAVLVSWEVRAWAEQGWGPYWEHFTGDGTLVTLLAVPESWYAWSLALLAAGGATAAYRGSPFARPLGMTVCAPLLGLGLFRLSFAAKAGLLESIGTLGLRDRLSMATSLFEVLVSLAVLAALAGRGEEAPGPVPQPGTIRSFSSA